VDINNDGLQDLYLCNSGPDLDGDKLRNQLLINKGNFKFEDEAERYGIADNNFGVQAEFFDMDNDGDLDLWINNHGNKKDVSQLINKYGYNNPSSGNLMVNLNKLPEEAITKAKIQLYRNDNGKFSNISISTMMVTLMCMWRMIILFLISCFSIILKVDSPLMFPR